MADTNKGDSNNTDKNYQELFEKEKTKGQLLFAEVTDLKKKFDGVDPQELSGLRSTVKALESQIDKAKGDKAGVDEEKVKGLKADIEASVRKSVQAEVDKLKSDRDAAAKKLQDYEVRTQLLKLNIIDPACFDLVSGIIDKRAKVKDGQVFVINDDGSQKFVPDNPNQPYTLEHLANELVKQYPQIAADKSARGTMDGDHRNGTNGTANVSPQAFASMSNVQQQEMLKGNPQLAKQLLTHFANQR